MRPIVLSLASGYNREDLEPFILSCRRHIPEADIVLLAAKMRPDTVEWLDEQGVIVQFVRYAHYSGGTRWKAPIFRYASIAGVALYTAWTRLFSPGNDRIEVVTEANLGLCVRRFFGFRQFLRAYAWRYSHALLIDCRDTIFQANPFPASGLHVYAENERIMDNHFAKRWFQLSYGMATWKRLGPKPWLCSGATLGDVPSMLDYLDAMCAECLRVKAFNSVDQAVYNFLIHENAFPATLHLFGDGDAVNLNDVPLSSLHVENGRLLKPDGSPYAIVHQYDRVKGLSLAWRG